MAKNVVVGDVLVNGAHKYTVVQVEKVAYTDLVNIVYKTMKTETIRSMTVVASDFVTIEQNVEVAADLIEETNEVAENPVKSVNLYIKHCKKEIESIKTLIVNAVDEDEKLFQKGRMKCKREELAFLENRKSEILSKQETVLPANPVTKTPLMAKFITIGDVVSKGRYKCEITNIKEYGDTITLFYSTIGTKNKTVRFMKVPPTHFITVYENVG